VFNPEHLDKLCEGAKAWNAWRDANPNIVPELSGIRLTLHQRQLGPSNGGPVDLHAANLEFASLPNATLTGADLADARLVGADLTHARLDRATLSGADLTDAILDQTDLTGAALDHALLFGVDLSNTRNLTAAQLELAYGDASTRLPGNIAPPQSWFPAADYDDDLDHEDDYSGWSVEAPVEENLYEILGLTRRASNEEIRAAYRTLAKKLHPDINPTDKKAQDRFTRVSAAYRLLNDPAQRQRYDRGEIDGEGRVSAEFEARRRFRRTAFQYSAAAVGAFLLTIGALAGVWWTVLSKQPRSEAVRVAASQPKTGERLGQTAAPAKPTKDERRTAVSGQGSRQAEPESKLATLSEDAAQQVPPAQTPRPTAPDVAAPAPRGDSKLAALSEDAAQQVPPAETPKPTAPDAAAPPPRGDTQQQQAETQTGTEQSPTPDPVAAPASSAPPDLATAPAAAAPGNGTAAPPTAVNEAAPASPAIGDTNRPLQEQYQDTAGQTAPPAPDREGVAAPAQGAPERKASPGSDSRLIAAAKQRLRQSWQEPTARDFASQVLRDRAIAQSLGKKGRAVIASAFEGISERRAGVSQDPSTTSALPKPSRPARAASLRSAAPAQQRKPEAERMSARPQARSASMAADNAAPGQVRQQQHIVSDILAGGL
jgi:hypothetical protein